MDGCNDATWGLVGWCLVLPGLVGLGWVGWLVKMLGAVVVFFRLKWWSWSFPRLPLSFWCLKCVSFWCFLVIFFRVCWSLFFQPKKHPREGRPQIPTSKCRRILGSTSSRVCALPGVLSWWPCDGYGCFGPWWCLKDWPTFFPTSWQQMTDGLLGGGFKYFLFSPLFGEDFQFD